MSNNYKIISAISDYRLNVDKDKFEIMRTETGVIYEFSGRLLNDDYKEEETDYINDVVKMMKEHQKYINNIKTNLDKCLKIIDKNYR
jgi:hypothetical protein